MSDPRRTKTPPPPEVPKGYRSTRRGSKALKQAKKAEKQHRIVTGAQRTGRTARNVLIVTVQVLAALTLGALVLLFAAMLINQAVRWNAQRVASKDSAVAQLEQRARENVVIIGADGEKASGFLALRVDQKGGQVFGIAIPDGAFLDVPGQGFERIGDAYPAGPEVVVSSVANYLTVPFRSYIVVPSRVYRDAIRRQVVRGLPEAAVSSNLSDDEIAALSAQLAKVPQKNVALVPMPVKPIKLGDQTYFEPQKAEVADLLKSWWGVDPSKGAQATRAVIYNGAGKPGIAGEAAQQLIRSGIRVIDTQNADSFDYDTTKIIVRRGDVQRGNKVRDVLGVGDVSSDPSSQDVTDLIVIIGKDYRPAADAAVKKEN
ncbi:MAG TPA: LytR C-terminal domain-containing protein [Coriobacteriia bacterium]|nr:LytR C-terminal domain-containing protein [Coriobacteriia bacterium]